MAQPWDAERSINADLARSLIESQFPELAPLGLEPFGAGWDNTAYLANGRLVFRFPRRQVAVPLIETEIRRLPLLASRLPLPIPSPIFVGRPGPQFPWPFAGYERLPGRTADRIAPTDPARGALARPLGAFLAALHAIPPEGVGPDEIGRMDVNRLSARIETRLGAMAQEGLLEDIGPWRKIVAASAPLRPSGRPTLVHGDLYSRHLLIGEDGRMTGIIDWGDLHAGSAATDLSIAWSFLPSESRGVFRQAYGPIDETAWRLARLRAVHYGVVLIEYARGIRDEDLLREGRTVLRLAAVE